MKVSVLNKNPIQKDFYGEIDYGNLHKISVKNCILADYLENTSNKPIIEFLTKNISKFNVNSPSNNILVDIKFHEINNPKHYPCIPGWHIDGSLMLAKKVVPEHYLLYICGDICFTEFCHDVIEVSRERKTMTEIAPYDAKEISALKSGEMIFYDGTQMHRGTPANKAGSRLLIRMMTSTNIRGQSYKDSIFIPYDKK